MEGLREIKRTESRQKRLYKQAKELKKKQELEDAKNQAADLAVNKLMHKESDFDKILEDIQNAAQNQKRAKFTKKYGFVACNQIYNTKAGLHNLP